jgi:ABC-type glycerol-3-phosphate transport system substrate-binding protein
LSTSGLQKRLATTTALLAAALVLVSCGGSGGSDEDEIAETIETALVKTDPDSCTELMTQVYLEQTFQSSGENAVEGCESNARAEESDNPPVKVSGVEVDGAKATAEIGLTGGEIADQTILVALVDEDGWKLDEFVRFTEFDPEEVVPRMVEGFEGGETAIDPRVVDCLHEALKRMSRPELESMFLGEEAARQSVELYETCE